MDFPLPPINDRPLVLRWRVDRLGPEDVVKGWVAGPCVRVTTHWSGIKTTACVKVMTGGKLPCICDTNAVGTRVVGYQPMIAKDGDRIVLLVADTVAKKLLRIAHGTPLQVTRPKNPTCPHHVKQLVDDGLSVTMQKRVHAVGPQDIKPFLLHLWQNAALTTFFAAEFYPSTATIHQSKTEVAKGDKPDVG